MIPLLFLRAIKTETQMTQAIYDFKANLINGETLDFSIFKTKVLVIVNTASLCGFTKQYQGLQQLYCDFKNHNLEVLAFPCDQFGNQEPGDNRQIENFCRNRYELSFKVFEKIKVNGEQAHPLFKYLKTELPGLFGASIKWNFTKFLISADGLPLKRFAPLTKPERLIKVIRPLLTANH